MAKTKLEKLGSAKRFGARYGYKPKHKFAKIEKEQRKRHKCPYCNNLKVKRVAVGIWRCKKCNSKFTGKAYSIAKIVGAEETPAKDDKNLERLSEDAVNNLEERQDDLDEKEGLDKAQEEVA